MIAPVQFGKTYEVAATTREHALERARQLRDEKAPAVFIESTDVIPDHFGAPDGVYVLTDEGPDKSLTLLKRLGERVRELLKDAAGPVEERFQNVVFNDPEYIGLAQDLQAQMEEAEVI